MLRAATRSSPLLSNSLVPLSARVVQRSLHTNRLKGRSASIHSESAGRSRELTLLRRGTSSLLLLLLLLRRLLPGRTSDDRTIDCRTMTLHLSLLLVELLQLLRRELSSRSLLTSTDASSNTTLTLRDTATAPRLDIHDDTTTRL
jgi:hypothetical protein